MVDVGLKRKTLHDAVLDTQAETNRLRNTTGPDDISRPTAGGETDYPLNHLLGRPPPYATACLEVCSAVPRNTGLVS